MPSLYQIDPLDEKLKRLCGLFRLCGALRRQRTWRVPKSSRKVVTVRRESARCHVSDGDVGLILSGGACSRTNPTECTISAVRSPRPGARLRAGTLMDARRCGPSRGKRGAQFGACSSPRVVPRAPTTPRLRHSAKKKLTGALTGGLALVIYPVLLGSRSAESRQQQCGRARKCLWAVRSRAAGRTVAVTLADHRGCSVAIQECQCERAPTSDRPPS